MRKIALGLLTALSLLAPAAAWGQACPPVAALPDTERRVAYSPSASTGPFSVTFPILGDSTDAGNWIEVWLNGVRLTYITNWTFSLSSGGSVATACRPITNGQVTLTVASTGTLQIVGARRPRRTSQLSENQGVAARDFNQVITDLTAQNRETWDKINDVTGRTILGPPGETAFGVLPLAATRAGKFLTFDVAGLPTLTSPTPGLGNVIGPGTSVVGHYAKWGNTTGTLLTDGGGSGVNIVDFGAVCSGGTGADQATVIQNAINAVPTGGMLYIPACAGGQVYDLVGSGTCILTVTRPISIVGDGPGSFLFPHNTVPNTRDVLCINSSAPASGFFFRNFQINAFGAAARHAISVNLSGTNNVNRMSFEGLLIGQPTLSGNSIAFIGTASANVSYSNISTSLLESIGIVNGGDGITIDRNVIAASGSNKSIVAGFQVGAGGFQVLANVITGQNCMVCIVNGVGTTISYNELETPSGLTNTYGFLVDLGTAGTGLQAPQLVGNTYAALAGTGNPVAIRVRNNTSNTRIADARNSVTSANHIQIDAGATDTAIDTNAQYLLNNAIVTPQVSDAGTRTATFRGPVSIVTAAASLAQGLTVTQAGPTSGTTAGPLNFNLLNVTMQSGTSGTGSDSTGNNNRGAVGFRTNFFIGGTNYSAQAGVAILGAIANTLGAPTSSGDKIGVVGTAYQSVSDTVGLLLGMNAASTCANGCTATGVFGMESNPAINTGGTAVRRLAYSAAPGGNLQATGAIDAAYAMSASALGIAFKTGFLFTNQYGAHGVSATGDVFTADSAITVANFANLGNMTVTGNILNFPNATLTGAGTSLWPIVSGGLGAASTLTLESTIGVGTTDAIIFKTASQVTRGRIASGGNALFGVNASLPSPGNATFEISRNGSSADAAGGSNDLLRIVAADGASNITEWVSIGAAQTNVFAGSIASGTLASPGVASSGASMFSIRGFGFGNASGSDWYQSANIDFLTTEAFSSTAGGSRILFATTPTGGRAKATAMVIQNSGGLSVGTATDPGIGVVSALNGFQSLTAAKTLVLKQGSNGSVGTFVCTSGGTITISNTNVATTDAIIISLNTAGGTISTPPAMKTITGASQFQVLCATNDTATYNYAIIKNAAWLLDPANDNRPMWLNEVA